MYSLIPAEHRAALTVPLRLVAHALTQLGLTGRQYDGPLMWGCFHAPCLRTAQRIVSILYMPRHAWHGLTGDQQSLNRACCVRAQDLEAEASYRAVLDGRAEALEALVRLAAYCSTINQHHFCATHKMRTALRQPANGHSHRRAPWTWTHRLTADM